MWNWEHTGNSHAFETITDAKRQKMDASTTGGLKPDTKHEEPEDGLWRMTLGTSRLRLQLFMDRIGGAAPGRATIYSIYHNRG